VQKHHLRAQCLGLLLAVTAGIASAQSTITLDSFDLTEPTQKIENKQSPTPLQQTKNCLFKPNADGCDRVKRSSQSFSLSDVVNLGIVERSEVEAADNNGNVVKVEDRVDPLPSIDLEILFEYNSASIQPNQVPSLISLSRDLSEIDFTRAQLVLMGHTDGVGSAAYNRELSHRRAQTVARFLSEAAGIPIYRIRTSGMGFDYPKTPYDPTSAVNRRVQILLVE
jgi:OOP family OmpA-OmpF porin